MTLQSDVIKYLGRVVHLLLLLAVLEHWARNSVSLLWAALPQHSQCNDPWPYKGFYCFVLSAAQCYYRVMMLNVRPCDLSLWLTIGVDGHMAVLFLMSLSLSPHSVNFSPPNHKNMHHFTCVISVNVLINYSTLVWMWIKALLLFYCKASK